MNFALEDSTTEKVPKILEDILEKILSQNEFVDSKQKDIFFILIIVLMTENRLVPVLNNGEKWENVKTIAIEQFYFWKKSMEVYEAAFLIIGFNDIRIKLIMCPLGATVLISVMSEINSEVYSVCLPLSRYVVSPQASTIPMIFRDLKHLCHNFKNKIITPVKSSILNHCGYASASLIGMPEEIFFDIMLMLPPIDIVNISKCCSRLKLLLDNEHCWHQLYIRDFKDSNITSESNNSWKILYKQAYITRQEKQQRGCLAGTLHDFMEVSDYVSYIDNPLWDDMIT